MFERTAIEHVGSDGVTISSGADPASRDCTISNVHGIGVGVATAGNARGVIQGCEIARITGARRLDAGWAGGRRSRPGSRGSPTRATSV